MAKAIVGGHAEEYRISSTNLGTFERLVPTNVFVDCQSWREAISSAIDGEDVGPSREAIDSHIAGCSSCAEFSEFAHQLRRSSLRSAEVVPDQSADIKRRIGLVSGVARWTFARAVLAVCAIEVIAFSVPDLLGSGSESAHDARHLGAFSVAFGVTLLVAVLKPTRARMMMPIAMVLAVALTLGAIFDLAEGRIPLIGEARHIPEVVSAGLLWLMGAPSGSRHLPGRRPIGFRPTIVDSERRSA